VELFLPQQHFSPLKIGEIWQNCNLVSGLGGIKKKNICEKSNILQNHGLKCILQHLELDINSSAQG